MLRVSGPPRKVILRLLLLLRSASTVLLLLLVLLLVLLLLGITSSTKTVSTTPTCTCTSTTASTYATIILPTGHISTTIIVRLSPIELPPPATPPPTHTMEGGLDHGLGWGSHPTLIYCIPRYPYYYATICHVSFGLNCLSDECSTQNSVGEGWYWMALTPSSTVAPMRERVGMWWNVQRYGTFLPHFNQTPALM